MNIRSAISRNAVPLLFAVICAAGAILSNTPPATIVADLMNRFDRNIILVLSLIIPVTCGLGMNFGIVLGAMCGQIGLVIATIAKIGGGAGILTAGAAATVGALICGLLAGKILNRTKGQEMITSMIVGYFSNGIYQFICLFVIGGLIHVQSNIILTGGIGIKNTVDLAAMQYAVDGMKFFGISTRVDMFTGIIFFALLWAVIFAVGCARRGWSRRCGAKIGACVAIAAAAYALSGVPSLMIMKMLVRVPIPSLVLVMCLCALMRAFMRTKLGQDMRAIGHGREVAGASGIRVDKIRVVSIMISTVIAAWGQIIFYQNLGTMDAYYGHERVGTFCVAALLIGGASVKRATIGQAVLGTILFHLLFTVSPLASQNLFNSSMVGGYFRMTLCYGVIAVALMLHAWKSAAEKRKGVH